MAKVKCYWDKGQDFGITEAPSFYAYPIEVEERTLKQVKDLRELMQDIRVSSGRSSFPKDAQDLADFVKEQLDMLMLQTKRTPRAKNVKREDEE